MEIFLPDVWATVLTWQSPRLPCDFYESRMTKEIRNQNHQSPSRDESLSKLVEMSNGARASARFTVGRERTLEMPGLFSLRTQKRRERRAPHSAQSRHLFARGSIAAGVWRLVPVSAFVIRVSFGFRPSDLELLP